jgi:hypothetical protein
LRRKIGNDLLPAPQNRQPLLVSKQESEFLLKGEAMRQAGGQFSRVGSLVLSFAFLMLLGGCDLLFPQRDILDAARLYEKNPRAFERIRKHYPGPFTEVRRIPSFEDVDNRPEDIAFLKEIQGSVPAEVLDLYSWGDGGPDVIRVVVGAYGLAVSGSFVAVIYFENFVREDFVQTGVEVFDNCDERSLSWLKTAQVIGFADVYCRINDHWYAYQSVT